MFGRPLAKVFLVAMGTYQALYWTWLKLEAVEEEREKKGWSLLYPGERIRRGGPIC